MSKQKFSSKPELEEDWTIPGDDDCAICRAMRLAELRGEDLTAEELDEAFLQAAREGAVVGTGEDLMKEDKIH